MQFPGQYKDDRQRRVERVPYVRTLLPPYAGFATFARSNIGGILDVRDGTVAVLGIPLEAPGMVRPGVREGPEAIRRASIDFCYEMAASEVHALEDMDSGRILSWHGHDRVVDLGDLTQTPSEGPDMLVAGEKLVEEVVRAGGLPILLGGSGAVSTAGVAGLAHASPRPVGLIHVSSHLDLAPSDRRDGADSAVRWSIDHGFVSPGNTVFIGVQRYVEGDQWETAQELGALMIFSEDIADGDVPHLAANAINHAARGGAAVYLSIDADVIDAGFAAGTPEIVVGGIPPRVLLELAANWSTERDILAIDVVDVAPPLDVRGRTERIAAEVIIELLGQRVFSGDVKA